MNVFWAELLFLIGSHSNRLGRPSGQPTSSLGTQPALLTACHGSQVAKAAATAFELASAPIAGQML